MQRIRAWHEALKREGLSRRRRLQLIAGVVTFNLMRGLIFYVALPAFVPLRAG